jgi:hypothetical protein
VAYAWGLRDQPAPDFRRAALEESIALARETGDASLLCEAFSGMGDLLGTLGRNAEAARWGEEALAIARKNEDRRQLLDCLAGCAAQFNLARETAKARSVILECIRMAASVGALSEVPNLLYELAEAESRDGRRKRAARLLAAVHFIEPPPLYPSYRLTKRPSGIDNGAVEAEASFVRSMTLEQIVAYALEDDGQPAAL